MTSFYADSFLYISNNPQSICAFVTTTRPLFNSSIIPVTLNIKELWNSFNRCEKCHNQSLLEVFQFSHTLQFAPSLMLSRFPLDSDFSLRMLSALIRGRRYFCRSLKHFCTNDHRLLVLICQHVPSLQTLEYHQHGTLQKDDFRDAFARLTMLTMLNLTYTSLVECDPDSLSHLKDMKFLKTLHLSDCCWKHASGVNAGSGARLHHLPYLPALEVLHAERWTLPVTDDAFAAIAQQKRLRTLRICECSEVTARGLASLSCLTDLVDLDVGWCQLNDESLSMIAGGEFSLVTLDISLNFRLTDAGLQTLASSMIDLEYLDLNNCNFTDKSLKSLSMLKRLKTLKIYECPRISDDGVEHLINLPNLEEMHLGSADEKPFTDRTADTLLRMETLQEVHLWASGAITSDAIEKLSKRFQLTQYAQPGDFYPPFDGW